MRARVRLDNFGLEPDLMAYTNYVRINLRLGVLEGRDSGLAAAMSAKGYAVNQLRRRAHLSHQREHWHRAGATRPV